VTDHFDEDRLSEELRASLARHAREAPRGDLLAERIIHETGRRDGRARLGWRTWTLPLIAAGAVAGIVAAVVGIENYHPSASAPPVAGRSPVPDVSPSVALSVSPGPEDSATAMTGQAHPELHDIRIMDLTFASENEGWALGSADCLHGPGRCSALFHTKGAQWWSMPNSTPFNVPDVSTGCSYRCVSHIRFANSQVGYVFGPSALLMTTDGGRHWTPQDGGALALESLDNNVIRVTASPPSGCPGPCNIGVETAQIGSTRWTPVPVDVSSAVDVVLARGGPYAYLLVTRNPAGGAGSATSTLYRSSDGGQSWQQSGEPCPQAGGEVDSYTITAAPDGTPTVLCANRTDQTRRWVAASANHGASFPAAGTAIPGAPTLIAQPSDTVLLAAGDGLARSTDGGRTWHAVQGVSGQVSWLGFESPTVGRAVSATGGTIWTTRNGGRTWTAFHFN
jgi:photosystem II stability/assembly factor-like uncharacterized protein